MLTEDEQFCFNFPYGRGSGTDGQAIERIIDAAGELRVQAGIFFEDSPKEIDRMDASACTAALKVARAAERVLARFPLWMVQGCFGELLASGGGDDREPLDGMFDGIARANLDALLADIEAEGARNARLDEILGLAEEGDAQ